MLAPRSFDIAAIFLLRSWKYNIYVSHPLKSGSLCITLLHYCSDVVIVMRVLVICAWLNMSLYMAMKQSFVAFFLFVVGFFFGGVHQPGWDVEGGAPQKMFWNRWSKSTHIYEVERMHLSWTTVLCWPLARLFENEGLSTVHYMLNDIIPEANTKEWTNDMNASSCQTDRRELNLNIKRWNPPLASSLYRSESLNVCACVAGVSVAVFILGSKPLIDLPFLPLGLRI